jgi:squalene-hopene/tetraprenyl-beta-curcumene cyclase
MGLCACGDLDRLSVQRGVRYLLSDAETATARGMSRRSPAPGFPSVFYLKYDMYRQNFPLMALATYANYRSGGLPPAELLQLLAQLTFRRRRSARSTRQLWCVSDASQHSDATR